MAIWENAILTRKGLALLAKLTNGTTLYLQRAAAGSGYVDPESLPNQTAVTEEKQELYFATQSYPEEGACAVPVKLHNTGIAEEYTVKQIGIYAFDPDEGEILYLIAQANAGQGTNVPAERDMPGFSAEWTINLSYGQADNVSVIVDPANTVNASEVKAMIEGHNKESAPHAGVLATQAELTAHRNDEENPHNVTAEQIGLGNVDNTPDSQKNVAFASEAGTARKAKNNLIVRLKGGRTEGTDLFTYDGSTAKSVNITPANIGAAPAAHTHSADDINTGTLNSNRLPTVPVSKGGTGATTAADARTNLGITPENIGALPRSGGTMTGPLTLNGDIILKEGVNYGTIDQRPAPGVKGRIFFVVVE